MKTQSNIKKIKHRIAENRVTMSNLVDIEEVDDEMIQVIFQLADDFKESFVRGQNKKTDILRGKSIINFFFEKSTRTRTSFELAGKHLGADTINVTASSAAGSTKGEILIDTARTLNAMNVDMVILRHAKAGTPQFLAKKLDAAVVSAGDGYHQHPSQALIDLYTLRQEFKSLKNKKITIVGDIKHSRVAGSLMRLLPRQGMKVTLSGPATMMPKKVEKVFDVTVDTNAESAFEGKDVLYNIRVQRERGAEKAIPTLRDYAHQYCINQERVKLAKSSAIVMDAGPVNREIGIRSEVLASKQSRVEKQVENGLFIRLAILSLMLGE